MYPRRPEGLHFLFRSVSQRVFSGSRREGKQCTVVSTARTACRVASNCNEVITLSARGGVDAYD